jgi:hypothetical protein
MRLLLEVLVFAALITLAWDRTFRDRATEIPMIGPRIFAATPAPATAVAATSRVARGNSPIRPPQATVRAAIPLSETPAPANAPARPQPVATANGGWMWDSAHRGTLDHPSPGAHPRP